MKLLMVPHYNKVGLDNGVGQVIYNYHKYLPKVGIEITTDINDSYDLSSSHLGHLIDADIMFNHGFWWGNNISDQKREQNKHLVRCCINAKAVVVPSNFVAETFRRDFRLNPHVIPHGIDCNEWKHRYKSQGYVLWNKNRVSDVCNPYPVIELAKRFPNIQFVTTYCNEKLDNVSVTGRLPFEKMKSVIQKSGIYLATAEETFGIGTLEALSSGIPVLGFNWGGTPDIVTYKEDGYLVNPGDYNGLADGLMWLLDNRNKITKNCINKANKYTWLEVANQIKNVCKSVWIRKRKST